MGCNLLHSASVILGEASGSSFLFLCAGLFLLTILFGVLVVRYVSRVRGA